MRKKLLMLAALLSSIVVSACLYEYAEGEPLHYVNCTRIPYISHVNGIRVASATVTEGGARGTFSFSGDVVTNFPISVRISTIQVGSGPAGSTWYGVRAGVFKSGFDLPTFFYSENLGLALQYSCDGGSTWTTAARRRFKNAGQASLDGMIFGSDVIPLSLAAGSSVKLRLLAYVSLSPPLGNFTARENSDNYRIRFERGIGSQSVGVGKVSTLSGFYCDSEFVVSVTIGGNRRGGK